MKYKLFLLNLLSILCLAEAQNQDASTLYNTIKNFYGNKSSINENINKPLTGTTSFKTLDNSTVFDAPMQCPSSSKAVLIEFSNYSGDFIANIKIDTDLDGAFDYFYTTVNISGVCSNGIISCKPGTWQDCKYYYWEYSNNSIKLIETQDTSKTGTCSCANISCGITKIDQPLFSLIGGGISQAIMKKDSRFLISKSKWNGNTLELYGQSSKNCSKPDFKSYGEANPQNYYKTQTPPSVSISDIEIEQGNEEYSPYNIVKPITSLEYENGKQIGLPDYQECIIRNSVYNSNTVYYSDGGCYYGESNPCRGTYTQVRDNLYKCAWDPTSRNSCGPVWNIKICGNWETGWNIPDDEYEYIKINGSVIRYVSRKGKGTENGRGTCYGDTTKGISNCKNYSPSNNFVDAIFSYNNLGSCNGYANSYVYTYFVALDNFRVSKTNTCPSDCKLIDEWVCDKDGNNCIQTVKDGNPLLVSLQPQCFNYTTNNDVYVVCTNGKEITISNRYFGTKIIGSGWFYIKRKYNCGKNTLDIDISRTEKVLTKTEYQNQNISYIDTNGKRENTNFNLEINNCQNPVCIVEVPQVDTSVFSDNTNKSQIPSGKVSKELEIRTCLNSGNGSFSCPLEAQEKLIEDCKCNIDQLKTGFQKAVTALQILKNASKDMICSSSPP